MAESSSDGICQEHTGHSCICCCPGAAPLPVIPLKLSSMQAGGRTGGCNACWEGSTDPAEVKASKHSTVKAVPFPAPADSHLISRTSLLARVWGTLRSSVSFPVAEAEAWTDWQGEQLRKRQKHSLEQAYQYASGCRPLQRGPAQAMRAQPEPCML